jgi:hypothetical protein
MKITPTHYAHLKNAIAPFASVIDAMRADILAAGKAKDPEKRLRWDLTYKADLSNWICANLYGYLDDSHIDTALKKIVAELA